MYKDEWWHCCTACVRPCSHLTSAIYFYRPQRKFAKVMFLQVSVCPQRGACVVARGGGGMCMVARGAWVVVRGACMVPLGGMHGCSGGHAWFFWGHAWFFLGACVVFAGGHAWFLPGGHAWFFLGGVCVFFRGACMVFSGGACMVFFRGACMVFFWGACMVFSGGRACFFRGAYIGYNEIWSMSGRYASYCNAFLFLWSLPSNADIKYEHRSFVAIEPNSCSLMQTQTRTLSVNKALLRVLPDTSPNTTNKFLCIKINNSNVNKSAFQ